MARTPAVTRESVPERERDAFDAFVAARGEIPATGPGSVMLNAPEVAQRALGLAAYLRTETSLSPRIRELAMLLASEGADLIALEMMEDTVHARMAMAAAVETGLPVWLGVSTRLSGAGGGLVGFDFPDTPLAEPLDALIPLRPAAVNIMHTPPEAVAPALDEVRRFWDGPVGAYPELGDFEAPDWRFTRQLAPGEFVAHAMAWVGRGARVLGGCCGTLPEHIRALKEAEEGLLAARRA